MQRDICHGRCEGVERGRLGPEGVETFEQADALRVDAARLEAREIGARRQSVLVQFSDERVLWDPRVLKVVQREDIVGRGDEECLIVREPSGRVARPAAGRRIAPHSLLPSQPLLPCRRRQLERPAFRRKTIVLEVGPIEGRRAEGPGGQQGRERRDQVASQVFRSAWASFRPARVNFFISLRKTFSAAFWPSSWPTRIADIATSNTSRKSRRWRRSPRGRGP